MGWFRLPDVFALGEHRLSSGHIVDVVVPEDAGAPITIITDLTVDGKPYQLEMSRNTSGVNFLLGVYHDLTREQASKT